MWGLTAGGASGVEGVLRLLQAELAEVMAITGAPRVADIDRSVLGKPASAIAW
ncbi:MAG: alpha-hydroxy-acid oxidizing protein [Novosphingobium sp.]